MPKKNQVHGKKTGYNYRDNGGIGHDYKYKLFFGFSQNFQKMLKRAVGFTRNFAVKNLANSSNNPE